MKYQKQTAAELTENWNAGKHDYVRGVLQQLPEKSQIAYLAAQIAVNLAASIGIDEAETFVEYLHGKV